MRILFVCDRVDVRGGVEKLISILANYFVSTGDDVRILTRFASSKTPAYALPASAAVVSAGVLVRSRRLDRIPSFFAFARYCARYIQEYQPDVIILNGADVAALALSGLPKSWRQRCISCDHNNFSAVGAHWRWLRRRVYPDAGAVVSLTDHDLPAYRELNPRARRIYNASDLKCEFPVNLQARRFLAIGRLTPQKGFDLLLNAWAQLKGRREGWSLRIVGSGEEQQALERQIQQLADPESVELLPATSDVVEHFAAASAFVLSSRYEGLPVVLLEAMSCGLPCIAFDCPTGPGEVLGGQSKGLVPAGDVQGLAKVMEQVISDATFRAELSRYSQLRSERFSLQRFLSEWHDVVAQVAVKSAGRKP